jgi:ADP-heptose:LPS heptosyltransferase
LSEAAAGIDLPVVDVSDTSLLQIAAIISRADMFVGSDSGLAHVAGAAGTASVVLFSVDRPERVSPWEGKTAVVQGANHDARNITVVQVEAAVRSLPC